MSVGPSVTNFFSAVNSARNLCITPHRDHHDHPLLLLRNHQSGRIVVPNETCFVTSHFFPLVTLTAHFPAFPLPMAIVLPLQNLRIAQHISSPDLADSGLGNSRSKEDPSFEELCEQTRMFEEVRVSGGGGTSFKGAASSTNFGPINSVGVLDETTQSSWSGFEGRRNGANLNTFNFDPISPMTSVSASSEVSDLQ